MPIWISKTNRNGSSTRVAKASSPDRAKVLSVGSSPNRAENL